jgi:hypothetical protein
MKIGAGQPARRCAEQRSPRRPDSPIATNWVEIYQPSAGEPPQFDIKFLELPSKANLLGETGCAGPEFMVEVPAVALRGWQCRSAKRHSCDRNR